MVGRRGLEPRLPAYTHRGRDPRSRTAFLLIPDQADYRLPRWRGSQAPRWRTKEGQPVSKATINQVLQGAPQVAGKGGIPQSPSVTQYLIQHGYTQWTSYQPVSRFWPFQWIEGGWLLALSVLLIAATVWLVRHRGA